MKLFVYGTLKRKHCRNSIIAAGKFLGEAKTVDKYRLFVGHYPTIKEDENGVEVEGELWDVNERLLASLDSMEGHPHLYKRKKINLKSHPDVDAMAYFYQRSFDGFKDCSPCWGDDRIGNEH